MRLGESVSVGSWKIRIIVSYWIGTFLISASAEWLKPNTQIWKNVAYIHRTESYLHMYTILLQWYTCTRILSGEIRKTWVLGLRNALYKVYGFSERSVDKDRWLCWYVCNSCDYHWRQSFIVILTAKAIVKHRNQVVAFRYSAVNLTGEFKRCLHLTEYQWNLPCWYIPDHLSWQWPPKRILY